MLVGIITEAQCCVFPLLVGEKDNDREGLSENEDEAERQRESCVVGNHRLYLGSLQRQARFVSSVICSLNKQV